MRLSGPTSVAQEAKSIVEMVEYRGKMRLRFPMRRNPGPAGGYRIHITAPYPVCVSAVTKELTKQLAFESLDRQIKE